MKEDLVYLQHFNHKIAQREPKTSLQKASINKNFIFLRSRDDVVSTNPHDRHVTKVPSSHVVNMTLVNSRFSEDDMAWSLGSIFRIFISTLHIITITVISIFKQTLHYLFSNLLFIRFAINSKNPAIKGSTTFFSSNNFVSSVSFVSTVIFFSSVIFSPDMVQTRL
jgi:hypothetical protein